MAFWRVEQYNEMAIQIPNSAPLLDEEIRGVLE